MVKRFASFVIEITFPAAFMASTLRRKAMTPASQISTFADSAAKLSRAENTVRQSWSANGFGPVLYQSVDLLACSEKLSPISRAAIHEPLVLNHRHKFFHAFPVSGVAMRPTKGEFIRILRKMLTAHMMPRTIDPALQQREK
jgi:hypothetical protein